MPSSLLCAHVYNARHRRVIGFGPCPVYMWLTLLQIISPVHLLIRQPERRTFYACHLRVVCHKAASHGAGREARHSAGDWFWYIHGRCSSVNPSQPFLSKFPKNSSWEIASTLPALIPISPKNPTPIHVHVHHEAVRVAYNHVVDLVPNLLPPGNSLHPQPDIILHIGLAAGRNFFTLEQGAHGRGFDKIPDVDGENFPDSTAEKRFPASKFPTVLKTSFDTSDVLARWKANLGYASVEGSAEDEEAPDVRLSPDAGNFLCGFIYYNSLAHYYSIKEDERPVVFLHVPDLSGSEDKLREGWEVAVALIKALVESKRKNGAVDALGGQAEVRRDVVVAQVDDTHTQGT